MRLLLALVFGTTILFLLACTDSDSYLFDGETENIEVDAYMSYTFDSSAIHQKQDTVTPGDSLFFISKVYPSKSIRSQAYYWTLDEEFFANEYSFKGSISTPGIHRIVFVYVDYFGDTLSDTLSLAVGTAPYLDSLNYIPASGTQQVPPSGDFNFVWNAQDPDSLWQLRYHFVLQEAGGSGKILVDTLLNESTFSYLQDFLPLQKYQWEVQALNELEQYSDQVLHGFFYTSGLDNMGALQGHIKTSSRSGVTPFALSLRGADSSEIIVDSTFNIKPLPSGKYTMSVRAPQHTDYGTQILNFSITERNVLDLDTIVLNDTIPPVIQAFTDKDTLEPLDTLRIIVRDGGGKTSFVSVRLDGYNQDSFTLVGDTLTIPADFLETSWSYKILTVTASDYSDNRTTKNFYIRPKTIMPGASHD